MRKLLLVTTALLCLGISGMLRAEKVKVGGPPKTHSHHKTSKVKSGARSLQMTNGQQFSAADQAQLSDQLKGKRKKANSRKKKLNAETVDESINADSDIKKSYTKSGDTVDDSAQGDTTLNMQKSPQKAYSPMDGYIKQ
jgi:hypothetical protein